MTDLKPEVGDRVRLVHTNGDTAEVTVAQIDEVYVDSRVTTFWFEDGWSVGEILPKPVPDEPTGLGAAVEYTYKYGSTRYVAVRTVSGFWADGEDDVYSWHTLVDMAKHGTIKVLFPGYVVAD